MEFDPIHQEALNKLSQTNCTVFLDRLYIPNRQSLFPNYSIEREREKIPIPFAAKKLHTRSLEHLVGNRTISKIESNQSGNCVIVRVPVKGEECSMAGRVLRTNIHIRGLWTKSSIGSVRYVLPIPLVTLLAARNRERERERERERKREREQSRVGLHSKRVHRPKRDSNSPIGSRASRGRRPRNDVKCRCTIESPRLLEIAGHWRAYLDRVCLGLRWHRGKILLNSATKCQFFSPIDRF